MDIDHSKTSKIFITSPIFPKHEMETFMEECYKNIRKYLEDGAERDRYDSIQKYIAQGQDKYEAVCNGYLYIILTNVECATKFFHEVVLFARDKLACIISRVSVLIIDFLEYLTDITRDQIFWLTHQLIALNASGVEGIVVALVRQISQGNVPRFSLYMAEQVLKLLDSSREWLIKNPTVTCIVLYAFIRLIEDHDHPDLLHLQQSEVDFCVSILEQHFSICLNMGRDFIRALQLIGRHPQISSILKLMNDSPKSLSPNFKDIRQFFQKRTPKSIILSRIPFDIENKLLFYTSQVPFKKHQRYQEWLYNQHFQSISSQSLLSDIIRYICCIIHPSNEILASNVVPRWALLNFILFIAQKDPIKVSCKFAIYYDWFFTSIEQDPNVMNLECGLLLLFQLNRTHPVITASLLEFLYMMCVKKVVDPYVDCKESIISSFRLILAKKVVPTLAPLLQCQALTEPFITNFKEFFIEFFNDSNQNYSNQNYSNQNESEFVDYLPGNKKNTNVPEDNFDEAMNQDNTMVLSNSDEIEDENDEIIADDNIPLIIEENSFKIPKIIELQSLFEFQELEIEGIKETFMSLNYTKNIKLRIDAAEAITNTLSCLINVSHETIEKVAICFSHAFTQDMALPCTYFIPQGSIDPTNATNATNANPNPNANTNTTLSTASPIFSIFRSLHYMGELVGGSTESMSSPILSLLKYWYSIDSRLGYHLLFYMIYEPENKIHGYSTILTAFNFTPIKSFLISDLKAAFNLDRSVLRYIIIDVVNHFHAELINDQVFIKILIDTVTPFELNYILNKILLGKVSLFTEFSNPSSLKIEIDELTYFSKSSLWKLFISNSPPVSVVMNIVSNMNWRNNSEELYVFYTYIKSKKPSAILIDSLLRLLPEYEVLYNLQELELSFDSILDIFIYWISKKGCLKSLLTSISFSINSLINDQNLCSKYLSLMKSLTDRKSFEAKSSESISNFLNHETIRQSIQKIYKKFSSNPNIQPKFAGLFDPFPMNRKISTDKDAQYVGSAHSKQFIDRR